MPSSPDNPITYIAKTDFRGKFQSFGIYQKDRLYHTYILGKTGTGKTTLLESLITQDIRHGRGLCLIDIHGDLAERMHRLAGNCRKGDLIHVDPGDPHCPYGYNPIRLSSYPKKQETPPKQRGVKESSSSWADLGCARPELLAQTEIKKGAIAPFVLLPLLTRYRTSIKVLC